MTKYILHGGALRTSADEGRAFFAELVKGLGAKPKILLCFFASPAALWQEKYDEWAGRIAVGVPEVRPEFAMATPAEFETQSQHYDALFVYGGNSQLLMGVLKEFKNYTEILNRFRIIAGSSAGAIMLSSSAWDCDERKSVDGLAFVPARTLVHFRSKVYGMDDPRGPIDWQKARDELASYRDTSLPVQELPEGEFVVYDK